MSAIAVIAGIPVAAATIWLLLHSSLTERLAATPRADRWHATTTPTFGGIGIFAGLVVAVGAAIASGYVDPNWRLLAVVVGCAILFGAGLIDDLFSLPPVAKLVLQLAAVGTVLSAGYTVRSIGNELVAGVVTVVWLVGMTNAFNLLDNMDGLAGSLGAIAAAFFTVDALTVHPSNINLAISLALLAGILGFLPFNLRWRRRAAVFMGDSGSQMLGFTLATLGLVTSHKVASTTVATLLLPVLILAVPILDTTLVTVVRILERRPISQGGRDHTSHRLVERGLSEKRAVVLLSAIAAMLGGTSLAYNVAGNNRITLVGVLVTFVLLVQFATFLGDIKRDATSPEDAGRIRPLVLNLARLLETLIDFVVVGAAFTVSYFLLVLGSGTTYQRHLFMVSLPAILVARFAAFLAFGIYRRVWRYAGSRDAVAILLAVVLSEAVAYLFLVTSFEFVGLTQSIFLLNAIICTVMVGAERFGERALAHTLSSLRGRDTRHRTLIVGAGREGRSLVRELRETPGELVIGFVDDDPELRRRRLLGVPVVGATGDIADVLARFTTDAVLVTALDLPHETLDTIVAACEQAGVPCQFVRRDLDVARETVLGAVAGGL